MVFNVEKCKKNVDEYIKILEMLKYFYGKKNIFVELFKFKQQTL